MRELASPQRFERRQVDFVSTLSNPGLLYNIGNLLAFFGALALFMLLAGSGRGVTVDGFMAHFLGNWPAVLTTAASLVFWTSGVNYAKAWRQGFPPEAKSNNRGHALSTFGAATIGVALMGLARTEVALALAIIATILHAGGKLSSWRAPTRDDYFKPMPLYSRVPYATTLCLDMRSDVLTSGALNDVVTGLALPLFLFVATMFWARADWLLLQKVGE
jgi:hypothetical protein